MPTDQARLLVEERDVAVSLQHARDLALDGFGVHVGHLRHRCVPRRSTTLYSDVATERSAQFRNDVLPDDIKGLHRVVVQA